MAATLKIEHLGRLTLTESARLLGSLRPEEEAILKDISSGAEVSGRLAATDYDHAVFSRDEIPPGKKRPKRAYVRIPGTLPYLRSLVTKGWLRFADHMGEGFGNFYLTEGAKAVWARKR